MKTDTDLAVERVRRRTTSALLAPPPEDAASVLKADDEMRFTLAPLYVPGISDAHDEYVDARDLQRAAHDYIRKGDLRLRLMHDDSEEIGEVVEMMTIPWDIEVPMTQKDGSQKAVKLPAGTVLVGTIWDERAWPAVKDGRLGGLSLGGRAEKVEGDSVPKPDERAKAGSFVRLEVVATD